MNPIPSVCVPIPTMLNVNSQREELRRLGYLFVADNERDCVDLSMLSALKRKVAYIEEAAKCGSIVSAGYWLICRTALSKMLISNTYEIPATWDDDLIKQFIDSAKATGYTLEWIEDDGKVMVTVVNIIKPVLAELNLGFNTRVE